MYRSCYYKLRASIVLGLGIIVNIINEKTLLNPQLGK